MSGKQKAARRLTPDQIRDAIRKDASIQPQPAVPPPPDANAVAAMSCGLLAQALHLPESLTLVDIRLRADRMSYDVYLTDSARPDRALESYVVQFDTVPETMRFKHVRRVRIDNPLPEGANAK